MNFLMALAIAGTVLSPPGPLTAYPIQSGAFAAPVSAGASAIPSTVTLDAMPYTRTVSCGTYTLTGTYTGSAPTDWTASPSGASGACTDTGPATFACDVDVDPDAVGEGVETITVGTESVTIGFYVDGEHSCFLSQNLDGQYNNTVGDLDAVSTWINVGSSALNVTQGGAASLKPTFRTGIVGGQPVVRCDGGDRLAGAAAADWTFLYDGTDYTVETIHTRSGVIHTYLATTTVAGGHGFAFAGDAVSNVYFQVYNATPTLNININRGGNTLGPFHLAQMTLDDDDGAGNDAFLYVDGAGPTTGARASTYSASTAQPLTVCAFSGGGSGLSGDLFRVLIYQSALTSTQRGINEAVDEWALGGTVPVVAERWHFDSSDSATITTAGSAVSAWRSTGITTGSADQGNASRQPTSTVSGTSSNVDFDGAEDYLELAGQNSVSNWHTFAVVTVDAVDTNGTGGNCELNDYITLDVASGLRLRNDAGTYYAIAHNNDGTDDCAEVTISIGSKMIIEGKADGTNVSIAVDGGSFTSVASGNQTSAAGTLYLGGQAFAYLLNGKIHEVRQFPDDLGTTARNAVIAELQSKWGL